MTTTCETCGTGFESVEDSGRDYAEEHYWLHHCPACDHSPCIDTNGGHVCADFQNYSDGVAEMCECELDWRCPLHAGQFTPLELTNHEWASVQTELDRQGGWF